MSIVLLDVPLAALPVEDARAFEVEDGFVYAHLRRYCSKFEPLPAITVSIDDESVKLLRGFKYLLVAKDLGRPTVRAVVGGRSTPAAVARFVARSGSKVLDWHAIRAAEERDLTPVGWHVVYFARPLAPEEKAVFESVVAGFLGAQVVRVVYDDSGPLAEFEAKTPVSDAAWIARTLGALAEFSRDCVSIVSYQGRRFGVGMV